LGGCSAPTAGEASLGIAVQPLSSSLTLTRKKEEKKKNLNRMFCFKDVVGFAKGRNFQVAEDYPKYLNCFREATALKAVPEKHACRGFFLQKFKRLPKAKKPVVFAKSREVPSSRS
jgi:hypothetical protein